GLCLVTCPGSLRLPREPSALHAVHFSWPALGERLLVPSAQSSLRCSGSTASVQCPNGVCPVVGGLPTPLSHRGLEADRANQKLRENAKPEVLSPRIRARGCPAMSPSTDQRFGEF